MKLQINRHGFAGGGGKAEFYAGAASTTATGTQARAARIRRSVGGMSPTDPIIVSYGRAIQKMKALDRSNPLSWEYQTSIHWALGLRLLPAWKTCAHDDLYFWPWHRMYLYWFERIVAKMAGDPAWTLPYWDYTSSDERFLPPPFRDPESPLYTAMRGKGWNSGKTQFLDSAVQYVDSLAIGDFQNAALNIYGTPHMSVHMALGGLMMHLETSALDPIFFLHHCNIDRIWDLWLVEAKGASDHVSDSTWGGHQFTFFTEDGDQVHMSPCQVLEAQNQLGYSYEGEPAQSQQACGGGGLTTFAVKEQELFVKDIDVKLSAERTSFSLDLSNWSHLIDARDFDSETVLLSLEGVEADAPPEAFWDVFVTPKGVSDEAKETHSVGTVALFAHGIRSLQPYMGPEHFVYPINRALQAVSKSDLGSLQVTFVLSGPITNGEKRALKVKSNVTVQRARLSLESKIKR